MHLLYNVEPNQVEAGGTTWEQVHTSSGLSQETDIFQFTYRILKKIYIRDPLIRVMRSRVIVTGLKSGWWFCESQLEPGNQGEIAERETCHSSISNIYHLFFFWERPWPTKQKEWRRQTYESHMAWVRWALATFWNPYLRDVSPERLSRRGFRFTQLSNTLSLLYMGLSFS